MLSAPNFYCCNFNGRAVSWAFPFEFVSMSNLGLKAEEVGHAPNCLMVETIDQSGACIFLGVNLEEIAARRMKRTSLRVFSALTSLGI